MGANEQQLISCVQRSTILSRLPIDQRDRQILMKKRG